MNTKRLFFIFICLLALFAFTLTDCARKVDVKEEKKEKKEQKKPPEDETELTLAEKLQDKTLSDCFKLVKDVILTINENNSCAADESYLEVKFGKYSKDTKKISGHLKLKIPENQEDVEISDEVDVEINDDGSLLIVFEKDEPYHVFFKLTIKEAANNKITASVKLDITYSSEEEALSILDYYKDLLEWKHCTNESIDINLIGQWIANDNNDEALKIYADGKFIFVTTDKLGGGFLRTCSNDRLEMNYALIYKNNEGNQSLYYSIAQQNSTITLNTCFDYDKWNGSTCAGEEKNYTKVVE